MKTKLKKLIINTFHLEPLLPRILISNVIIKNSDTGISISEDAFVVDGLEMVNYADNKLVIVTDGTLEIVIDGKSI